MFQFSSVAQLCATLCNPMDCSLPGLPVHHQLPELVQTHVHRVGDAIQTTHPLSSPSGLLICNKPSLSPGWVRVWIEPFSTNSTACLSQFLASCTCHSSLLLLLLMPCAAVPSSSKIPFFLSVAASYNEKEAFF